MEHLGYEHLESGRDERMRFSGRFSMISSISTSLNLIYLLGFDCFKESMLNNFGMERKSDISDVDLFGE